ncbi:carboxymuconolactone decarboxylase family protein [Nocardioides humi]|uniref:Carboxymuconolactone decarboxylase family protein n=1 Tax=Nocardioides humi TaxID=449461 RepID=A0ABN2ABK1_9ACTN|nr:carboxymuconolactone decarboxylase family protein [Nocardioides humi]
MPRVDIPASASEAHITARVYALQPAYAEPAAQLARAVREDSILPARTKEAVRYRIAQINGCLLCQAYRASDAREDGFTEEDYASIGTPAFAGRFGERERLAVEYAELFTCDHHRLDDAFFERLKEQFSDSEIVDLTVFTGRYLAFGRLTHVLGLDDSCEL